MNFPARVIGVESCRVRAGLEAPPRRGYLDRRSDEREIPERVLGLQVDAAARERDRDGALRPVLGVDAERRADAPQPRLVGRRGADRLTRETSYGPVEFRWRFAEMRGTLPHEDELCFVIRVMPIGSRLCQMRG